MDSYKRLAKLIALFRSWREPVLSFSLPFTLSWASLAVAMSQSTVPKTDFWIDFLLSAGLSVESDKIEEYAKKV